MKKYDFIKCKKCGQPLNKLIYGSLSADYKPKKYTRTAGCCKTDYTYECSNPDCKTKYKDKNIFITLPFWDKSLSAHQALALIQKQAFPALV